MAKSIKIRARLKGDVTTVKCLITHPMETGLRKDNKTGEVIPAHFINEVTAEYGGTTVMSANWGVGVSKNPYFSFTMEGGAKGEEVKISWKDNKGNSDSKSEQIK